MNAPWIEFPDLPRGSLGWRMGAGEAYLDQFVEWLYQHGESGVSDYIFNNPPPEEWQNLFDYHLEKMRLGKGPWEF